MDYRDTVILADLLSCLYKILRISVDLVINLCSGLVYIIINTVKKRDAHCDSPDIQILIVYHIDGLKYIS